MSALDDLRNKNFNTQLELCVLYWGDPVSASDENIEQAEFAAADLAALNARVKTAEENWHKNEARVAKLESQLAWWLETYDITMPCGHKNRYLLTNGRGELEKNFRGDCVCVICQLEKADNEIEAALRGAE